MAGRKRSVRKGSVPNGAEKRAQPRTRTGLPPGPTGRFMYCPGSSVNHPPAVLEITQGAKVPWIKCPMRICGARLLLLGHGWHEFEKYSFTREELMKRDPGALFFT